ncbi:MAG: sigma-54-dependent transcriptional regulator [Deferribacterales bacterium]
MKTKLLIVEDDQLLGTSLVRFFSKEHETTLTTTFAGAKNAIMYEDFDVAILDVNLPDGEGTDLLPIIKNSPGNTEAIVVTAYPEVQMAVKTLKMGAFDYVNKPFELVDLQLCVNNAMTLKLAKQNLGAIHAMKDRTSLDSIVGSSAVIQEMKKQIILAAQSDETRVLISGETGTGKELVAEAVHMLSPRKERPFMSINSAGLPEQLVESELFGYEQGAFTDARKNKKGLIEMASGGTLFMDEIGDLPMSTQIKLLRFLENGTFFKLGATRETKVNVRIITATNRNLEALVKEGKFREDLFFRLNVVNIVIPPLAERDGDCIELAQYYLDKYRRKMNKQPMELSAHDRHVILNYGWPGNVRELRNIMERTALFGHLPELNPKPAAALVHKTAAEMCCLKDIERRHILSVYESCSNNKTKAANILGVSRLTLRKKLEEYGVDDPD